MYYTNVMCFAANALILRSCQITFNQHSVLKFNKNIWTFLKN